MKIVMILRTCPSSGFHTGTRMRPCGRALIRHGSSLNPTLPRASPFLQFHGRFHLPPPSRPILGNPKREFVNGNLRNFSPICSSSSSISSTSRVCIDQDDGDFIVVNFYRFMLFEDPEFEVARHLSFLERFDIHGRIFINEQGINAQFSGPSRDALAYVEWLREDHRFSNILIQMSPCPIGIGHAFPRLKLRYKPSLVQFDLGAQDLPLLDPSTRATPLSPTEWRERLESLNSNVDASNEDNKKSCVLLDVRNGYEWDIGHFRGAQRPEVECFQSTSFGLSDKEIVDSDPLVNVDKDNTDILMYCTGGIRCDVYSTILRQQGFKNLYTLKGGISNYLKNEDQEQWTGNLFVFDSRLSLPPSTFKTGLATSSITQGAPSNSKFAKCYICSSQVHELRHRNCANLDCNRLFLCCWECVDAVGGCCCPDCKSAPRLRPVLKGDTRYQKWHIYRDTKPQQTSLGL